MPSHPNRGPKGPSANPTPEQIRAAREAAGLTQTEAATLIHSTMRAWQEWEAGNRRMHPGLWELFCLKAGVSQNSHLDGGLANLGLTLMTEKNLRDCGVVSLFALRSMSDSQILDLPNIGRAQLRDIRECIANWDSTR